MASIYTYDQFEQAAKKAGLYDQFSEADLNLARQNADAGMSILKYKQDWHNAGTDEARALANLGAENVRSSYGNYTGGGDGGSFHLNPMSPSSFQPEEKPTYENRYENQTQELINTILNRGEFTWDPATDPSAQAYQKQYAREGQRATQDTLAAASLATGGAPSSYAVSAATQAGGYYAAQMADKIPELYQQAYNRYLDEYNMQLQNLGILQSAEQMDYGKFQDRLNQYNTDRNFGYGQLLDEIGSQTQDQQEEMDKAVLAGEYGDMSFLQGMGIDTSNDPADWERRYNMALLKAEYGDYSGLKELGVQIPENGGSGSYYAGGGDGAQGETTGTELGLPDPDGMDEKSGLTNSVIDELWYSFPGGVVTADGLAMLQSRYPGLTAQQLQAAGFSVSLNDGTGGRNLAQNNTAVLR